MTETTGAAQGTDQPLDWITVKGFRSIACVEKLELKPINVLIGANGAGKSNLVNVFSLLSALSGGQRRLNEYVARSGGADRNLHFGAKTTQEVLINDTGNDARILRSAYLNDNLFLREDGENIAPFLYLLRERDPQSYERIKRTFPSSCPLLRRFRPRTAGAERPDDPSRVATSGFRRVLRHLYAFGRFATLPCPRHGATAANMVPNPANTPRRTGAWPAPLRHRHALLPNTQRLC